MALLAETDALHDTLSGPATQHLMQRTLWVFGDTRTARLASISVVPLYHLWGPPATGRAANRGPKTRPTGIDRGAPWEIVATCERLSEAYLLPVSRPC